MPVFSPETYVKRRQQLMEHLDSGLVLLLGHEAAPRNAATNT